jgi:hypothetical protein
MLLGLVFKRKGRNKQTSHTFECFIFFLTGATPIYETIFFHFETCKLHKNFEDVSKTIHVMQIYFSRNTAQIENTTGTTIHL